MFTVLSAYQFVSISGGLDEKQREITLAGEARGIQGLILIAPEGVNFTVAGAAGDVEPFVERLAELLGARPFDLKVAQSRRAPFRRLRVDVRPEIITFDGQSYAEHELLETHLSPEEWQRTLDQEDVVLLDVRNFYETAIGKFKNSVDPQTGYFSEFPVFLEKWKMPRDKKILTYCTGGVRCEKAVVEMRRRGFSNVFQLSGGILNYLEKFPDGHFEGECFVFDHRVSVDKNLAPSQKYNLCPHCGNPGQLKIECGNCRKAAVICTGCGGSESKNSCSKNCAHHLRLRGAAA